MKDYQNSSNHGEAQDHDEHKISWSEYSDLLCEGEELSEENKKIIEALEQDEELNQGIQDLVSSMYEENLDLSALQSKFLLLIKAALARLNNGGTSRAIEQILKKQEKELTEQLSLISHHVMMKYSDIARKKMDGIDGPEDNLDYMQAAAIKHTKQIMKSFAIYEIYKMQNPRRIAGETRRDNFVNNFIVGGIRHAMKYAGGKREVSRSELVKISRNISRQGTSAGRG